MDREALGDRVRSAAALDHAVTQAVYRLLAEGPLTRDAATEALHVPRSVAAFHLDKLVEARLAHAHFERLTGRSGPGAGRPAKVYQRSEQDLELSLPERRYDLAGGLLAEAVERATEDGVPVEGALRDAALETGRVLGEAGRGDSRAAATPTERHHALLGVLESQGYEPDARTSEIVLRNCPFHALAEQHRALVCGMNLQLVSGIIQGIGGREQLDACLEPEPGSCCVRIKPS